MITLSIFGKARNKCFVFFSFGPTWQTNQRHLLALSCGPNTRAMGAILKCVWLNGLLCRWCWQKLDGKSHDLQLSEYQQNNEVELDLELQNPWRQYEHLQLNNMTIVWSVCFDCWSSFHMWVGIVTPTSRWSYVHFKSNTYASKT